MALREQLKRLKRSIRGRRWIVKRNEDASIKEVKLIFNPSQYTEFENSKKMYTDKQLSKILDTHYEEFVRDK